MSIKIVIHSNKRLWKRYILPKRITLKCNPPIYRWLIFGWSTQHCKKCGTCITDYEKEHYNKHCKECNGVIK